MSTAGELEPSELGTLDYWENVYSNDLDGYLEHGDVGDVWFGYAKTLRVIRFIETLNIDKENDKIIDLGCGNGVTLLELWKHGFKRLKGVDYSQKAIELAQKVLTRNNLSRVELETCDILADKFDLPGDFKLVHDKGTYDAISLNPDDRTAKRQRYIERVHQLLLPDGYFVLSSCNWTKEELEDHFRNYFELETVIPEKDAFATFQFGGGTGYTLTKLVFRRK